MINRIGERIKKSRNQKGFTLVELMVVVAIIGILSAIAVPVYRNVTEGANRKAVMANLRTIDGAIIIYTTEGKTAPANAAEIKNALEGDYLQAWPTGPDGVTYSVTGEGTKARPYMAQADKGANTGAWFGDDESYTTSTIPDTWK